MIFYKKQNKKKKNKYYHINIFYIIIIIMNKTVIIISIILFVGFLFLYIDLYNKFNKKNNTPSEKIVYRYIPRVPYDELQQEVFPTDIFESMFSQPTPWINTFNDLDARQAKLINKYFMSQI
jgi:hypothetical protein